MNTVPYYKVSLTDGFWKKWQDVDCIETSRALYDQFYETGRIPAMDLDWKEGMPNRPHVFWDSDVAKWIEGACYSLRVRPDDELAARVESVVDKIVKGQSGDGYFNSVYLTFGYKRFSDRTEHELYTAGHLIEAAVAHHEATGSRRFLDAMCRFADLIEKVFVIDRSAPYATPGHQELELALVRLYEATGERRYLELSRHFVEARGRDPRDKVFSVPNGVWPADPPLKNQLLYDDTYAQDDRPARELEKAGGHAVRAMYFYSAMADIAKYYDDAGLLDAAIHLFDDEVRHKMYVTGGVSAERYGEAIGTDYVLPNALSYAETCASVAMANFAWRLFTQTKDGKYTDMVERQMYNGALVGLSMDGDTFYYDNALECRVAVSDFFARIHARPLYPACQRQKVFECSCCPPNIYRFIASMGRFFYSWDESTVWINQYADGVGEVNGLRIVQHTDYPYDGRIQIRFEGSTSRKVALRIPGWCRSFTLSLNGKALSPATDKGYVMIEGGVGEGDLVELVLDMPLVFLSAHPDVVDAAGRLALARGPLVYTIEGADNPDVDLFRVALSCESQQYALAWTEIEGHKVMRIDLEALYESDEGFDDRLYKPFEPSYRRILIHAIPYFAWSNRGANDMTVWIKRC